MYTQIKNLSIKKLKIPIFLNTNLSILKLIRLELQK